VRVPKEFAKAADAQIVIRLQQGVTGKVGAAKKLSELPQTADASSVRQ
jgi:hypothetical protein